MTNTGKSRKVEITLQDCEIVVCTENSNGGGVEGIVDK